MSFLYVFLTMQVIFAVLLACPVVVEASFQDELSAKISFLFFHYTVAPKPSEEEKTEKQKQKEEEKAKQHTEKHQLRELFQKKAFQGFWKSLARPLNWQEQRPKKSSATLFSGDFGSALRWAAKMLQKRLSITAAFVVPSVLQPG